LPFYRAIDPLLGSLEGNFNEDTLWIFDFWDRRVDPLKLKARIK
jgi:hypothetical protein